MAETIFRTAMFDVVRKKLRFKGRKLNYDYASNSGSVVILATHNKKILLERNYRYTVSKYLYELPAGHIDKGEKAHKAAPRELTEETGYIPNKITLLFKGYASPGSSNELYHSYLATDLRMTKTDKEPDEDISVRLVTLTNALKLIKSNRIIDMKSIATILFYAKYVAKR